MIATNLQPGKAVFVSWEDSATIHGWQRDPVPDVGHISTVGYVVENNKNILVITSSLNDQFSCLDPISIPWSCITKTGELGIEWQK